MLSATKKGKRKKKKKTKKKKEYSEEEDERATSQIDKWRKDGLAALGGFAFNGGILRQPQPSNEKQEHELSADMLPRR